MQTRDTNILIDAGISLLSIKEKLKALDLSPSEFWTTFFDISGLILEATGVEIIALAALAPVGYLVTLTGFSLTIIYFLVKQYDGTTLGANKKITHTIMSTLEV